jgi:hypothetical protein
MCTPLRTTPFGVHRPVPGRELVVGEQLAPMLRPGLSSGERVAGLLARHPRVLRLLALLERPPLPLDAEHLVQLVEPRLDGRPPAPSRRRSGRGPPDGAIQDGVGFLHLVVVLLEEHGVLAGHSGPPCCVFALVAVPVRRSGQRKTPPVGAGPFGSARVVLARVFAQAESPPPQVRVVGGRCGLTLRGGDIGERGQFGLGLPSGSASGCVSGSATAAAMGGSHTEAAPLPPARPPPASMACIRAMAWSSVSTRSAMPAAHRGLRPQHAPLAEPAAHRVHRHAPPLGHRAGEGAVVVVHARLERRPRLVAQRLVRVALALVLARRDQGGGHPQPRLQPALVLVRRDHPDAAHLAARRHAELARGDASQ